ncbi:MAG: hypothetical protein AAF146_23125, partial [Bacteroidota bacterium]
MTNTPYSYHIFLFPFKWDFFADHQKKRQASFIERTKLKDVKKLMESCQQWQHFRFNFKTVPEDQYHTYNEYIYFHDFVRSALALQQDGEVGTLQYKYDISNTDDASFIINLDNNSNQSYQLALKEIILNYYDVGVAFLSFHLENHHYSNANDVLQINNLGRRIYPPFLGAGIHPINAPKDGSLPDSIELTGILAERKPSSSIIENFSYFNHEGGLRGNHIHLPNHIAQLFPSNFIANANQHQHPSPHLVVQPVIDDRMYVMSLYFNDQLMDKLKTYGNHTPTTYDYQQSDFWYSYLFVDGKRPSVTSQLQMEQLLGTHTYHRWINEQPREEGGHLFGISRYSFVILTNEYGFSRKHLVNHFRYQYFQMVALSLIQRTTILRFSGE